jgi:hypothetical protein
VKGTHGTAFAGGEVSHMAQGASRGPRVNIAARPQHHHGGAVHCSPRSRLEPRSLMSHERQSECANRLNGQCVRGPGEDSTGAGAERELGFDPQPTEGRARAGRVQRSKGSTGTTRTHRRAAGWPRGVPRTKDPTDDPAASRVGCALLMTDTFDGTCERRTWGVPTSTPGKN